MSSVFSKIISGEIPCYKIAEDQQFIAFLDVSPLKEGHVLVVPKIEVNKIFDVSDDFLGNWLLFAKPIAKAIEATFDCKRCGVAVIGLEVPHAHMHLVPINSADDLNFTNPKLQLTPERFQELHQLLLTKM